MTFENWALAAAWRGPSTIVDFAVQPKGGSLLAALDAWHAKADGRCAADAAFQRAIVRPDVTDTSMVPSGMQRLGIDAA